MPIILFWAKDMVCYLYHPLPSTVFLPCQCCPLPILSWKSPSPPLSLTLFFFFKKFSLYLIMQKVSLYLFHSEIIFSQLYLVLLTRLYKIHLINIMIFHLYWHYIFWAILGSHLPFYGCITLMTHSHLAINKYARFLSSYLRFKLPATTRSSY